MNSYWWLIVIPKLSQLIEVLGWLGIICVIVGCIVWMCKKAEEYTETDSKQLKVLTKHILKIFLISMILFFITCFIPTKKEMIQLKVISVISELKGAEDIPQKFMDRLNDLLDSDNSTKDNAA